MTDEALEQIRHPLHAGDGDPRSCSRSCSGQPELEEKLQRSELRQLDQRIGIRCCLRAPVSRRIPIGQLVEHRPARGRACRLGALHTRAAMASHLPTTVGSAPTSTNLGSATGPSSGWMPAQRAARSRPPSCVAAARKLEWAGWEPPARRVRAPEWPILRRLRSRRGLHRPHGQMAGGCSRLAAGGLDVIVVRAGRLRKSHRWRRRPPLGSCRAHRARHPWTPRPRPRARPRPRRRRRSPASISVSRARSEPPRAALAPLGRERTDLDAPAVAARLAEPGRRPDVSVGRSSRYHLTADRVPRGLRAARPAQRWACPQRLSELSDGIAASPRLSCVGSRRRCRHPRRACGASRVPRAARDVRGRVDALGLDALAESSICCPWIPAEAMTPTVAAQRWRSVSPSSAISHRTAAHRRRSLRLQAAGAPIPARGRSSME